MREYTIEMSDHFPDIGSAQDARAAREYCTGILESLAASGNLCLTHLLIHPATAQVHDICFGAGPVPDSLMGDVEGNFLKPGSVDVPDAIKACKIKLESADGQPIRYSDGQEVTQQVMASAGMGSIRNWRSQRRLKTSWRELPPSCEVDIVTAIKVLDQCGVGVVPANTSKGRDQWWKVYEVHPSLPWYPETTEGKKAS